MFRKTIVAVMLLLLGALLYVPYAQAETKLEYGAAFRLRQENWDNVVTLNTSDTGGAADRNFFRLRTQVWGKAQFNENLGVYARLVNEAKYFSGPFTAFKTNPDKDRFDQDEINIDNLYFDAKNIFGLPVDVRIGRQDFLGPDMYGEGFLIMDGTPGDGSKTFYFNAAKAKVKFNKDNSLDIVYINNTRTDNYMPSIHPSVVGGLFVDHKKVLTASREEAFVFYGRSKVDNVAIEPYYIHKTEGAFGTVTKLKLNTVGARIAASVDSWKFGGEFAHQFGDYANGVDRTGNGGYIFVGRKYENAKLKPEFDLRFVYLSGNDPNTTNKVEGWDPLFSRNPNWNELIIYPMLNETAAYGGGGMPGYWTNIEILKATVNLNFSADTKLALTYQYLWAPEESGLNTALLSNDGKTRGHLPTAILFHKFSKNLDGMLQFEYFMPGNFYKDAADNASFLRWQLQFRI